MQYQKLGDYYLLKKISERSGMAEVFLAKRTGIEGFEKFIAIKKILPHLSEDEDFVQMFISEAKLAAQLNHQNIVQIHDFGKIGDTYYIAMEYLQGKNLKKIWETLGQEHTIPLKLALEIMSCVCKGLDYAHRKEDNQGNPLHLVHRDVSPQNVIVSYEGEIKVIDFGIAKAAFCSSSTRTGVLKGKISYMSPEQASGHPVDCRSDIFACGILLHELVTGVKLFRGDTDLEVLKKVQNVEIPPPSQVKPNLPKPVEDIILKALDKDPVRRFQTAAEMGHALENFMRSPACPPCGKSLSAFVQELYRDDLLKDSRELKTFTAADTPAKDGTKAVVIVKAASRKRKKVLLSVALALIGIALSVKVFYMLDKNGNPASQEPSPAKVGTAAPPPLVPATEPQANAILSLVCSQSGAEIFIDDTPTHKLTNAGESLVFTDITPNVSHVVKLTKAGYQDWNEELKLNPGETKTVEADMAAMLGKIFVDSVPAGAQIFLDDQLLESKFTPATLEVAPDAEYHLRIAKEGFQEWETTVKRVANQTVMLSNIMLSKPSGGLLIFSSPQNAQVYINGKLMDQTTPADIEGLAPGEYQLTLMKQNYEPYRTKFTIAAGKTVRLSGIELKSSHKTR